VTARLIVMAVHTFATSWGRCELHYEHDLVTGFRLPEAGLAPRSDPAPAWVLALAQRVEAHLAGQLQDFAAEPYDWARVSSFQQSIYQALLAVKPGATATYGDLAAAIGQPPAVSRAVGTALGQNPWPLLVPCHRCVGANGRMVGFSGPGGIATKLRLLALEGAQLFADG
jgi:methylated-DNA-[protein]-cysteine S-methyltransferase